jgi:hypothetical protein
MWFWNLNHSAQNRLNKNVGWFSRLLWDTSARACFVLSLGVAVPLNLRELALTYCFEWHSSFFLSTIFNDDRLRLIAQQKSFVLALLEHKIVTFRPYLSFDFASSSSSSSILNWIYIFYYVKKMKRKKKYYLTLKTPND